VNGIPDNKATDPVRRARGQFIAMAATYGLGVFNDSFFRTAVILMTLDRWGKGMEGWVMVVFNLPYILFAAGAGWMADRFSKRHVVITSKILELAAMSLGAVGIVTEFWPLVFSMLFMMGLQSCIFNPAINGSIPELYPDYFVNRANGRLKVVTTALILSGIAICGPVKEYLGLHFVAAGIMIISVIGLAVGFMVPGRPAADAKAIFPWAGPIETARELMRIRRDRLLATVASVNVFIWFCGAMLILLIQVFAEKVMGWSQSTGTLLVAAEAAGVAVGGVIGGRLSHGKDCCRLFPPVLTGMAATLAAFSFVPDLPANIALPAAYTILGAMGICGGICMVPSGAFVQMRPEPERKGTVIASVAFAIFAAMILAGVIESGLVMIVPIRYCFTILAAAAVVMTAWVNLRIVTEVKSSPMVNAAWGFIVKAILLLRYRVRIAGLEKIVARGRKGILLLPNHPALIDPVILTAHLYNALHPRPLADRRQTDRPLIGYLAERTGAIPIEDMTIEGTEAAGSVRDTIDKCIESLRRKENIILYPAGRILRSRNEEIGANSAVKSIIENVPEARIVLAHTRGLWGSSFGWASGHEPSVLSALGKGLLNLLASGIIFMPKREVTIELHEPADFPRDKSRTEINRYLEHHYNSDPSPNTYVPCTPFETGGTRTMPEPRREIIHGDPADVPDEIRNRIFRYLGEAAGTSGFNDDSILSTDLGMDSLMMADLLVFLQSEYNYPSNSFEGIQTVGDVLLAASGKSGESSEPLEPPPPTWTRKRPVPALPENIQEMNIPQAFLYQANRRPACSIIADQASGVKTCADMVLCCTVLKNHIRKLPGHRIGIMMPASCAGNMLFLSTLLAGKTPAMINWTLGRRQVESCMDTAGVEVILTSGSLVEKLRKRNIEFDGVKNKFVCIEDIAASIGWIEKFRAFLESRLNRSGLQKSAEDCPDQAVILFTSGSEAAPKAVPLTHKNILSNIRDVFECFSVTSDDCLVGILPTFHSFGLTITTVLPLVLGVRCVYSPDPTAGGRTAAIIGAYEGTILAGTPAFLNGIIRSGDARQLSSLRIAVSGAEKCPDSLFQRIDKKCPEITVMEGYGATECSPIISANHEDDARRGTIGKIMSSLDYRLLDPDTGRKCNDRGKLLVSGPSVFAGYLSGRPDPFVELDGCKWYDTGDIVEVDSEGIFRFSGRLKRFVKIGGEMVSLPAIEAVLAPHLTDPSDKGPAFAVTSKETDKRPEIVLVTTRPIEKQEANNLVAAAGLSSIHRITRVTDIDRLPLLGNGKTDYRALKSMVVNETSR